MAITSSGQYHDYDNVKETFPASDSITGTIDGVNNGTLIVGTSTLFTTELQEGQYLYIAAQSAFRKIISIVSATVLYIDSAFPTATFTGATARKIPNKRYKSISWEIDAAGTAVINGITFPASNSATLALIGGVYPEPILVDSTGNTNNVYIQAEVG